MTGARRRGRPSLDPSGIPTAELFLNVTAADYDALFAHAAAENVTVQTIIRRAVATYLRPAPTPRSRQRVTVRRRIF